MRPNSDIELPFEFLPDVEINLVDHAGLMLDLSRLLGRKADLVEKRIEAVIAFESLTKRPELLVFQVRVRRDLVHEFIQAWSCDATGMRPVGAAGIGTEARARLCIEQVLRVADAEDPLTPPVQVRVTSSPTFAKLRVVLASEGP